VTRIRYTSLYTAILRNIKVILCGWPFANPVGFVSAKTTRITACFYYVDQLSSTPRVSTV